MERVIEYLKSPGSGADGASSYAEYLTRKMQVHPPMLSSGVDYVGFSGVDASGTNNFRNAEKYVADVHGRAGIIGDTPWGKFIDAVPHDPEFAAIRGKFEIFMRAQGLEPFRANYQGALQDMMWNAGSPEYFENAIASRRPIVAFVENAPPGRGFSNFELTTALNHPDAIINGYPVSVFSADPLAFASKSAAEFQQLERIIAQAATANSGHAVGVEQVRSSLNLIDGYDAVNRTLFNQPIDAFKSLSFEEMSATRAAWVASRPGIASSLHPGTVAEAPERVLRTQVEPGTLRSPPAAAESVLESAAARGARPGMGVAARGLGAIGVAVTAYDTADTLHDVGRLRGQGNAAAAEDRITRFAAQNLGGWGGAVAGAGFGAAAGVESGPGLLLTGAIGGVIGAVAGDQVAGWIRDYKINHQQDRQGNNWTFDPARPEQGWTRIVQTGELDYDAMRFSEGMPVYQMQRLTADPALADQLDYKASSRSIELALGAPPQGHDPYRLPASAAERAQRTPFETGRVWTRDPRTEQWQQEITAVYDGRVHVTRHEAASPERTAELERQSQAVIAENATRTPVAMAAQYQAVYERNGWSQYGPLPEAVRDAVRHPGRVVGSDGDLYERGGNGQWTHDGLLWDSRAEGNLKRELDATYQQQQQNLSIPTLEPVVVRPDPELRQGTSTSQATPSQPVPIQQARPDHASPSPGDSGGSSDIAQERVVSIRAQGGLDANPVAGQTAESQQAFLAQQRVADGQSHLEAERQEGHQREEGGSREQARDIGYSPMQAQAAAEPPNPWDQTEIGQRLNKMFNAVERGDEQEISKLACEHAQTPGFREWDAWGQENHQLAQLEQQRQQDAQEQQNRGFSR